MIVLLLSAVLSADVSLYAPTPPEAVVAMIQLAGITKTDIHYDLGSGDGRVCIAAAMSRGCQSWGIEIDPKLAARSERNVAANGVSDRCRIIRGDVRLADLSDATVITSYLLQGLLRDLIPRFEDLREGTRIVCYAEPLPGIKPAKVKELKEGKLYLYTIPLERECKT